MDNAFLIQLFFSFIVGSFWITLTTIIAEKYGSKIGGWIGGLPTTSFVALLFIGITQSPQAAVSTTTIMPIVIAFAGIFMVLFSLLIDKGFFIAFSLALLSWFVLTGILLFLRIDSFNFSLLVSVLIILFSYYILEKRQKVISAPKQKISYSFIQILSRALFAGAAISFAVLIARFGGPTLGGIFSAFPAFFISTVFIIYFSYGITFTKALIKSLSLSGVINVIVYTVAVRYLYPVQGLLWGTVFAYLITIISVYLTYQLLSKRIS